MVSKCHIWYYRGYWPIRVTDGHPMVSYGFLGPPNIPYGIVTTYIGTIE